MKTQLLAALSLIFLAACQKEVTKSLNTSQIANVEASTDSIYFAGLDVLGGTRNAVSGDYNYCFGDQFTVPQETGIFFKEAVFLIRKKGAVNLSRVQFHLDDQRKFQDISIETNYDTLTVKLKTAKELIPYQNYGTTHFINMLILGTGTPGSFFQVKLIRTGIGTATKEPVPASLPKGPSPKSVFIR